MKAEEKKLSEQDVVEEKHHFFVNLFIKDMKRWHLGVKEKMHEYVIGMVPVDCAIVVERHTEEVSRRRQQVQLFLKSWKCFAWKYHSRRQQVQLSWNEFAWKNTVEADSNFSQ